MALHSRNAAGGVLDQSRDACLTHPPIGYIGRLDLQAQSPVDNNTIHTNMNINRILIRLPMMGALMALTTVAMCYRFTMEGGSLPEGTFVPPISLLGCQEPARFIYQVGFTLTGIDVLLLLFVINSKLFVREPNNECAT